MTFSRSGSVALKSAKSSIQKRPPKRDCDCEKNLHGDLGGLLIITGLRYVYGETRLWVWWSMGYADFYVQIVNCWLIRRNSVDFCWIAVLFRGTTAVHAVHVDLCGGETSQTSEACFTLYWASKQHCEPVTGSCASRIWWATMCP